MQPNTQNNQNYIKLTFNDSIENEDDKQYILENHKKYNHTRLKDDKRLHTIA